MVVVQQCDCAKCHLGNWLKRHTYKCSDNWRGDTLLSPQHAGQLGVQSVEQMSESSRCRGPTARTPESRTLPRGLS